MGVSRDTEELSRLPTRDPRPLSRWAGEGQQPPAPRARLAARRQRLCSLTTHGLAACPQGLAASCCPGPAGWRHEVGHRSAVPSWCLSCMGLGDGARAGGTRGLGLQLPPTLWPRGGPLPPCRSFFTRRMGAKPHAQLGASAGPGFTQRRVRSPVGRGLGRGLGHQGQRGQTRPSGGPWVAKVQVPWGWTSQASRPGTPGPSWAAPWLASTLGKPFAPHVQATRGQPRTRHSRAPRRGDGEAMARVPQPIPGPGQLPSLAAEGMVCSCEPARLWRPSLTAGRDPAPGQMRLNTPERPRDSAQRKLIIAGTGTGTRTGPHPA